MGVDYAFFSASTLEGVAAGLQHGMERTVLFEIECLRTCPGVDVSVLSVCPGEKEVLFAPCTGLSLVQPAVPVDGGLGGAAAHGCYGRGRRLATHWWRCSRRPQRKAVTATLQHCNTATSSQNTYHKAEFCARTAVLMFVTASLWRFAIEVEARGGWVDLHRNVVPFRRSL